MLTLSSSFVLLNQMQATKKLKKRLTVQLTDLDVLEW